jgi:hypothetical protein
MPVKREQVEIGWTESRKTRVTWSRFDYLNPNPDRGIDPPVATPIMRDVIEYLPYIPQGTPDTGKGKPIR